MELAQPSRLSRLAGAMAAALALAAAPVQARAPAVERGRGGRASSSETRAFPFEDARLRGRDRAAGAVYIPAVAEAGSALPLVVLLHGLNPQRRVRPWLGGGPADLRPLVERLARERVTRPFLLSGLTQTRAARTSSTLFREVDLTALVDAVDAAVLPRARVERAAVVLVGHSGAGCAVDAGALAVAAGARSGFPRAVALVDTCANAEIAAALAQVDVGTDLYVRWQRASWPRDFARFEAAFLAGASDARAARTSIGALPVEGPRAHDDVIPVALEELLARVLPPR